MKIFILGKNGQLGTELVRLAKKRKHKIFSYSHKNLDITDYKKIEKLILKNKPDVLLNATAYHVVPLCEQFPDKAFLINTLAVQNLAILCDKYKTKFVHFSTDYVFDGKKNKPYTEDDFTNPLQIYGISKLAGEFCALNYCKNTLIIRTAYLYGGESGSRSKGGNFVLNILKSIDGKDSLEVACDQFVSPTYAEDLASATYKLLSKKINKGIYHIVNTGACSLSEFAEKIIYYANKKTKVIPVVRGQGNLKRPMFSALSNSKARKKRVAIPKWENALERYIKSLNL